MALFELSEEGRSLLTIFLILIPTALYIMGLMEGKKGYWLFLSGIFFHILSIVLRGVEIGRIPLTEKHDNISFMALVMAFVYWYFYSRQGLKNLGIVALPLLSIFMFVSLAFKPINTISPFLKSPWFYLHIFFYFIGYAFFGISACIGVYYLLNGKGEYELLQYKGIIHGWIVFSISLVAGSIWFFVAYGTYWLWTSKELWTTLVWFYYGLYLHARFIRGLRGRPAAVLGILGFAVALFAYFGVGTVIPSPPTQF
jgi:ABC-type transport system involved in cytochrome c biogenesis permease subunit